MPHYAQPYPQPRTDDAQPDRLASDLTTIGPDTRVVNMPSAGMACGPGLVPVVRLVLNGQVLFATDRDQPAPDGGPVLDALAGRIRRDAPDWHLTVVGHTDAIGSDAYNMDLSRRRAAKVLRALVDRGLGPERLSAVAIGKRQPVADNRIASGRALNRRVEFLLSRCLDANLAVVRQNGGFGQPVEVLRLDPASQLASIGKIALRPLSPAAVASPAPLRPGAAPVHPLPAPHYQPNTLSPTVQPSPLGAPVPY